MTSWQKIRDGSVVANQSSQLKHNKMPIFHRACFKDPKSSTKSPHRRAKNSKVRVWSKMCFFNRWFKSLRSHSHKTLFISVFSFIFAASLIKQKRSQLVSIYPIDDNHDDDDDDDDGGGDDDAPPPSRRYCNGWLFPLCNVWVQCRHQMSEIKCNFTCTALSIVLISLND